MKRIAWIVCVWVACGALAFAQDKADLTVGSQGLALKAGAEKAAPTLSTEQKQAVQILAQKIQIAQLQAQAAQAEFEKARTEISQLVQSLQKDGFDLDLQTLTYTAKKDPKKPDPTGPK